MIRNKMDKSQKVKVYQWCRDNKDNSGAQYPKVLKMTHYDYLSMKSNLRKRIPHERQQHHYIRCNVNTRNWLLDQAH